MNLLSDSDIEAAYNYMLKLDLIVSRKPEYVAVSGIRFDEAKRSAILHHCNYVKHFGIWQQSVDPYKILSWYGFYLAEHADDKHKISVLVAIQEMNKLLTQEKSKGARSLPSKVVSQLYQRAALDKHKDEYAIGKNGLYSAFDTALHVTMLS
jgi:hypothetical protein